MKSVHAIPSNNLFAVSQCVVPRFCPSSETKCTFVDLSFLLGLTLCALLFVCLFVYLEPLSHTFGQNAPFCHTCGTSL